MGEVNISIYTYINAIYLRRTIFSSCDKYMPISGYCLGWHSDMYHIMAMLS